MHKTSLYDSDPLRPGYSALPIQLYDLVTMAAIKRKSEIQEMQKCITCNTLPLDKLGYVTHILGKRHQKNLKSRNQPQTNDEANRTIHVTGGGRGSTMVAC